MSPGISSGKLRAMFPLIVDRADNLQIIAAEAAEAGKEIDVRELMAFIKACGFGIESDAFNDEHSTFRKLGKRIFAATIREGFVNIAKVLAREVFKNVHSFAPEVERNTISVVKHIMTQRNYKVAGKHDFIELLSELKAKGKIIGESSQKKYPHGTPQIIELELDDKIMAAQSFIFFAAGFETSSSTCGHQPNQNVKMKLTKF